MISNKIKLANALKELCRTKSLDDVTVTEITRSAGLTRQMFYHYFLDKYELAKWIHINDYLAALKKLNLNDCDNLDWKTVSRDWLSIIENEKTFYRNLYYSSSESGFLYLIHQHIEDTYKHILCAVEPEPSETQLFSVEFFCIGITLKIHEWIKKDLPYHADQLNHLIFESMPMDVKRIIDIYRISKKDLIQFTEIVASQCEAEI